MTIEEFCAEQVRQIRWRLARHQEPCPPRKKKVPALERPTFFNGGSEFQVRHGHMYVRCGCGGFKRNDAEMCKRCREATGRKSPAVYRAERLALAREATHD